MLIDKFIELNVALGKFFLRDAIVFKINEPSGDFVHTRVKDSVDPFPSKLPYRNMAIHFDDSFIWVLSIDHQDKKDQHEVVFLWLGPNLLPLGLKALDGCTRYRYAHNFALSTIGPPHEVIGCNVLDCVADGPSTPELDFELHLGIKTIRDFLVIISCKNISTDHVRESDKLQNKRVQGGKLPLVSYRILKIQNISPGKDHVQKGLWSNRVHLCRGHMREYTAEAPLFGNPKLVGRFWCPPHARGNKKKGMVIKDYEVPS